VPAYALSMLLLHSTDAATACAMLLLSVGITLRSCCDATKKYIFFQKHIASMVGPFVNRTCTILLAGSGE
jgi:hypothetical protein